MAPLSDADLLRVWETMRRQPSARRSASLLMACDPDLAADAFGDLSMGEATQRLLAMRTARFGATMACVADCVRCGTAYEFEIDANDLVASDASRGVREPVHVECDGFHVEGFAPTLRDCIVAGDAPDHDAAYRRLIERCLGRVTRDGTPVAADVVPMSVLQTIAAKIEAADPSAELLLSLRCPTCGFEATEVLDVPAFCWSEVERAAPRILAQVHALASAYGWAERDILAMSVARRARYLDLVST